jgi:hypothetical protein
MKKTLALMTACSLAVVACGGSDEADDMEGMPMEVMHTVSITEPADGSTVTGPAVTVRLATNVPIVVAGDMTPGTGHHHLFLDGDLSPVGAPIPTVPGTVVHMGNAASEFTFDAVSPGRHRLIAVVADGAHVPLVPPVVDTIFFTVQ